MIHPVCLSAFSQSKEISSDLCCFYKGGITHNENITHSFQKFIVVSFPTTLPGYPYRNKDMENSCESTDIYADDKNMNRAVAEILIGEWVYIHIFVYSCFAGQISFQMDQFEFDLKRNSSGRTLINDYKHAPLMVVLATALHMKHCHKQYNTFPL